MALALAAKVGGGFTLAAAAVVLVPRAADGGAAPGLAPLLVTGVLVTLATTLALVFCLRRDLGLPASIALFAAGYNALVVLVKFVLAPRGLYELSLEGRLEGFFDPSDGVAASIISAFVFVLYAAVLLVVYRVSRRRLERRRASPKRIALVTVVAAVLVFASGGLPLVFAWGGLEYVGFVLSSGVSLIVALALAGAVALATATFRSTAEQAKVVGDAALLVSVFWIGLAFLALYHALWVVYILVLTSIWPLKVITPK